MPGFGAHRRSGAARKSGRGKLPEKTVETRTEQGAGHQERHSEKGSWSPTARTTRGGCMSKSRFLYAQRASKKGRKNHRAEEGSALVGHKDFKAFRGGRRERLYERKRESQEEPPTDAGPARKALLPLI